MSYVLEICFDYFMQHCVCVFSLSCSLFRFTATNILFIKTNETKSITRKSRLFHLILIVSTVFVSLFFFFFFFFSFEDITRLENGPIPNAIAEALVYLWCDPSNRTWAGACPSDCSLLCSSPLALLPFALSTSHAGAYTGAQQRTEHTNAETATKLANLNLLCAK